MSSGDLSILNIMLEAGLVVKLVLIILVVSSVISWGIIFLKKKLVSEVEENNNEFLQLYKNSESLKDMMDQCANLPFSPFRSMFIHGFEELKKVKDSCKGKDAQEKMKEHFEKFGLGLISRALQKGVIESNLKLEKSLSTLASIGSVSPFIGLFGTVWGIINSFTGIAGGGATLDAVAPGIAEALVATAVGLAAAIPAVWFYNKYSTISGKINSEMDSFEQEFLNVVERSLT